MTPCQVDYQAYDWNGTQVPPEWHAWLNHIRKEPPHVDPLMIANSPAWKTNHQENLTGTRAAYKSYSTVGEYETMQRREARLNEGCC